MKQLRIILLVFVGLFFAPLFINAQNLKSNKTTMLKIPFDDYASDWVEVQDLESKGLTQQILKKTQQIYEKATRESNSEQIIKSLLYTYRFKQNIEENSDVSIVNSMQQEINTCKDLAAKALWQSILAQTYWQHFNNNRWQLLNRTEVTSQIKQEDYTTWDANKLTAEITKLHLAALSNTAVLQNTDIKRFKTIIENLSTYCPTLYDFLAQQALDYFSNDQASITKAADQFRLNTEAVFSPAPTFCNTTFNNADSLSTKFYALTILQQLISFHLKDAVHDVLIDADLKRLDFCLQNAVLTNKNELYLKALELIETTYKPIPESTRASYKIAEFYYNQANSYNNDKNNPQFTKKEGFVKALEICETTINRHPESIGGIECYNLKYNILQKYIEFSIEQYTPNNQEFRASLNYKNIESISGRLIYIDTKTQTQIDKILTSQNFTQEKLLTYLLSLTAEKTFSNQLPSEKLYLIHNTEIKIPAPSQFGKYCVLISANGQFTTDANLIAYEYIDVSNLSYMSLDGEDNTTNIYTLNRYTGQVVPNVSYRFVAQEYDNSKGKYTDKLLQEGVSDNKGLLKISKNKNSRINYYNYRIDFTKDKDTYSCSPNLWNNYYGEVNNRQQTYIFTDRSIYRPGQTVFFKGIGVLYDKDQKPTLSTISQYQVTLLDVNRQQVEQLNLSTNQYGSFAGQFTLPQNLLNGNFTIQTNNGYKIIKVEEYKRPKFEITYKPINDTYKLNEQINTIGVANSYSGVPIDGAKVSYRVVRQATYPYWWGCGWWRYPPPASPALEIINGFTTTNEKGEFNINFIALPDPTIATETKPQYSYQVIADVTDINGETQSKTTTIQVGYISLLANINIDDRINKDEPKQEFAVTTTNLAGTHQQAQVTITVHKLEQPKRIIRNRLWTEPDKFVLTEKEFINAFPFDVYNNEDDKKNWKKTDKVFEKHLNTTDSSKIYLDGLEKWQNGDYVIELTTQDKYKQEVKWLKYFTLFELDANKIPTNDVFWIQCNKTTLEPNKTLQIAFGTADENVHVLYEVEQNGKIFKSQWFDLNKENRLTNINIEELHRGGFTVHFTLFKHNRVYNYTVPINVPFTNKELKIETQTFRDKLLPGEKETWKLIISGNKAEKITAEMLATMYDASLDAFAPNNFDFNIYPSYYSRQNVFYSTDFNSKNSQLYNPTPQSYKTVPNIYYPQLNWFGFYLQNNQTQLYSFGRRQLESADGYPANVKSINARVFKSAAPPTAVMPKEEALMVGGDAMAQNQAPPAPNFSDVKIRTNLGETSFFYPQLQTNEKGEIIITFTAPETLTRWKMLGLAHTKDLKYGLITKDIVTQKQLMVVPNMPRFLRESDEIEIVAKINNLVDTDLNGSAVLQIFDALTMKPIDDLFNNSKNIKPFTTKAKQSSSVAWILKVPEGVQAITYKVIAKAGEFSDGEENSLPVLTNRMLVTESMPLPIRSKQSKTFTFDKLANNRSTTLKHQRYTLEFTSNPAWYAIQSLPYMMEYPYECVEQSFSKYYANAIASHIANSSPNIKTVFESWKTEAETATTSANPNVATTLLSNLEKNQELKALLLQETPWVMEAKDETERKKRVGILFDLDRMQRELNTAKQKVLQAQTENGGFTWFKGMPENRYMTQHIINGFAHLAKLNVIIPESNNDIYNAIYKAIPYLDKELQNDYNRLVKNKVDLKQNNLSYVQIHYLYMRSSFLKQVPITTGCETAFNYYKQQSKTYWLNNSKYMQALIAMALYRLNDTKTAQAIMQSLKENAVTNEEMGMYYKENASGWYWYQAPIEAQAAYIEAFDEVTNDQKTVDNLKVWLIKNKQTNNWKTTKATAEAAFALLLKGSDWLKNEQLVEITVGSQKINPNNLSNTKTEAGTGYFKTAWSGNEITSDMAKITLNKKDEGVSWGAVYWQYFEQLDKITTANTPLKIKKQLFLQQNTKNGPKLSNLAENEILKVGDLLKVRIEIRADRDMEYVHLKDMRASGFEPVNVLSQYKYQDGLGYYESTKDAATNFFIDFLPKGTYVFEYPLRVAQKGSFSNGICTMQCMYAPEFSAHSEGIKLQVK